MHRHVYEKVADIKNHWNDPTRISHEDWKCIKSHCTKVIRRSIDHPPKHRFVLHNIELT